MSLWSIEVLQLAKCNNEHELYDLDTDPHQMTNLLSENEKVSLSHHILGIGIPKVVLRLDSLLLVLKSYKGKVCVTLWKALHPNRAVNCLKDALNEVYDHFYEAEQSTRVVFDEYMRGYLLHAEGPQFDFDRDGQGNNLIRDGLLWHEWV
ncbi:hypothetical protein N7532_001646 [Penicillium argentinense]|uniref:Uncharacterized protein n=1 Tax=Penicillium argentinense TaxID=1131581 RepID=A0A9W9G347_9EURO|nr:uncharacterized protein N7532_001646 [Penicillium argentinense]KAJ5111111.1 hypothetical protein N7532_001646 [Penicillium argentinense]